MSREWERGADVNFILVPKDTEDCFVQDLPQSDDRIDRGSEIFFRVREGQAADCKTLDNMGNPACLGRAFFPGDSDALRELLIYTKVEEDDELDLTVLHELGHILGFVHEYNRFVQTDTEDTNCAPTSRWRGVTGGDPLSVMQYPQCDASELNEQSKTLSTLDRVGISHLYNLPRAGQTTFSSSTQSAGMQDILWHIVTEDKFELWRPLAVPNPGLEIEFDITRACYDGSSDCDEPIISRYRRPIPIRATKNNVSDILFYGPRQVEDFLVITPTDDIPFDPGILLKQVSGLFDNPLIGSFINPIDNPQGTRQQIFWVNPGLQPDPTWVFTPQGTHTSFNTYDDANGADASTRDFRSLVGLWAPGQGSGLPFSQVLWYRESDLTFHLTFQDTNLSTFDEMTNIPQSRLCGLVPGRQYVALHGNFDLDVPQIPEQQEIIWYAPRNNGETLLWHNIEGMLDGDPCETVSTTTLFAPSVDPDFVPQYKPVVGDFNGDHIDDIFWYRSNVDGDAFQVNDDRVWLLSDPEFPNGITVTTVNIQGDFTPVVGSFNIDVGGTHCEDILWHAPHTAIEDIEPTGEIDPVIFTGESPLWKSNCDGTFTSLQAEPTPILAYPVGYDPRQGRISP